MAKIFDIEANNLWPEVNKIWCLVIHDTDTKETTVYSDYSSDYPPLITGLDILAKPKQIIVGHNIGGYDLMVLKELLDWEPHPSAVIHDTWIMSMVLDQKRDHKQGLGGWGEKLGFPKQEFSEFDKYSQKMVDYCINDVLLNAKVYEILVEEAKKIAEKNPLILKGLWVESQFAVMEGEIRRKGWLFNMPEAQALLAKMETRMQQIEDYLEPLIGMICIATDSKDEYKEPAWRKDGCYTVATVKHFGYSQESGRDEEPPIQGPFCRIEFEQGKISSDKVIKAYLYQIGWEPDEWNFEKINGKFVKKSPKLTETSLEKLGEVGIELSEYNVLKNRRGILAGWIQEATRDGRLHGRMWTVGTPTFRCRHEVVANLPGVDAKYGKEMRSLLICEEGWSIVGADSSGNQMRGLCHYIGNDEFTKEVIDGDVHTRNAVTLQEFTDNKPNRKLAKPFLYAFLFGAMGPKLGNILTGSSNAKVGNAAKEKFADSIPGLKKLVDMLTDLYTRTASAFGANKAFIKGIDGRIIYTESPHKALNYILQTLEGITCKAAAVYASKKLQKEGIPHYFPLHYHDEFAVCTPDEYVDRAKEISVEAFTEAPKWFGVMCMSGDAKSGKTYAEVH
jgi:DNA polymerase I-like protein with 3'-5' exonuclease and polymerase domains